MSLLESIFYMMWRGLAIGIIISAPMGPVGILCIQRTLDKGRRTGFYTGIGAALSDLLYCLLTGFGLSFVEEFLERNSNVIQLAGSIVLIAFSIYLFKKNPTTTLRTPADLPSADPKKDILYGFLFTVSNPLIIFLIIGLFARFNFMVADMPLYHLLIGYIFILAGALAWWWIVAYFVNKVRSHFNVRSMWLINKIIGGIILLFACVGIASSIMALTSSNAQAAAHTPEKTYWNEQRGLPEDLSAITCHIGNDDFAIGFRAKFSDQFQFFLINPEGEKLTLNIEAIEQSNPLGQEKGLHFSATLFNDTNLLDVIKTTGFNLYGDYNSYLLERSHGKLFLKGGHTAYDKIRELDFPDFFVDSFGFSSQTRNFTISDISASHYPEHNVIYDNDTLDDLLNKISKSSDGMEGIWVLLDSSYDSNYMMPGGDYKVAIIKNDDLTYQIIYLSGAKIEEDVWKPGMLKATLFSTSDKNVYNVEWIDARHIILTEELKLQHEPGGNILTLQFPQQNTSIRFHQSPTR